MAAEAVIEHVTTVVIGAGHAGLATSRCLSERSIDHVVVERGEVANSWRRERWDSLRLLTPNWQSQLPGHRYEGNDPDGYMTAAEVVEFVSGYAVATSASRGQGSTCGEGVRDAWGRGPDQQETVPVQPTVNDPDRHDVVDPTRANVERQVEVQSRCW